MASVKTKRETTVNNLSRFNCDQAIIFHKMAEKCPENAINKTDMLFVNIFQGLHLPEVLAGWLPLIAADDGPSWVMEK